MVEECLQDAADEVKLCGVLEQLGRPKWAASSQKESTQCLHLSQGQQEQTRSIYSNFSRDYYSEKKMKIMPGFNCDRHKTDMSWISLGCIKVKFKDQGLSGILRWPPYWGQTQSEPCYGHDVTRVSVLRLAEVTMPLRLI